MTIQSKAATDGWERVFGKKDDEGSHYISIRDCGECIL